MLDSAPIGTHADNFFGEPNFSVPPEARRKHMALFAGTGITAVDPHGGFCEDVLNNYIPRHRKNDVIFFDPKSRTHSMGLNVLDCPRPQERGLVVSGIVRIFKTLWA